MTDEEIEERAEEFASHVSVSRRITADLYIGSVGYLSVSAIVKAAFIAGAKAERDRPTPQTAELRDL